MIDVLHVKTQNVMQLANRRQNVDLDQNGRVARSTEELKAAGGSLRSIATY
jgi:hypothetical protein